MAALTDAQLLAASIADPGSFAPVIRRHYATLYRYATRRIGQTEAEDLVSEAVAIAFRKRDRYDDSYPSALPWLYGIVTNLIRAHRRRSRAWPDRSHASGVP